MRLLRPRAGGGLVRRDLAQLRYRVSMPTPVRQRLAEVWARKWDGRWQFEAGDDSFQGEGVLVFSVRPAKVLAFAKGNFGHTRHLF